VQESITRLDPVSLDASVRIPAIVNSKSTRW
jgi:hypothetical protein